MKTGIVWFCLLLLIAKVNASYRIKDVASLQGLQETQLIGYGLVVGLRGTGDGPRAQFTTQSVLNMLQNLGIDVPTDRIRLRNVAAVMVTARMLPFIRKGAHIDVKVSSLGDARSLEGGTLVMSPLKGADGEIYALAQGPLSIGGYNYEDMHVQSSYRKNHNMVGEIPGGGIIQKEVLTNEVPNEDLKIMLSEPDFTTAVAITKAINGKYQNAVAKTLDAGTVAIAIPEAFWQKSPEFLAELEAIDFDMEAPARVVLNEKTGTVIAGGNIYLREVAVSHGNLVVKISGQSDTKSSATISPAKARFDKAQQDKSEVNVDEPNSEMKVLPASTSVTALAESLNKLGVKPRDIIAIFLAIKRAGALNAELVVM